MDDAISQMVAITNATPEKAQQYLQVADGDIEQAVSLFFETGGALDFGQAPSTTQPAGRDTGSGNAQNPISIDDDQDESVPRPTNTTSLANPADFEDDEAMARRLQQEMYGGSGGDDEPIRAPIARQTEVLAGPGSSDYYGGTVDDAIQERLQAFQSRRGNFIAVNFFYCSC